MIPKSIIKQFINRKLDTHTWVKDLTRIELDKALAQLNPPPKLNPQNFLHQRACFLLGVAYPRFCYWLDMGSGKSILALELLRYWFEAGEIKKALILVKSDKAFNTWAKQFTKFGIDVPYVMLEGSSQHKWKQLAELDRGFIFVAYRGATAMTSVKAKHKKKKKFVWVLKDELVAQLGEGVGALVLDESTACGHMSSLTFKLVDKLRKTIDIRYALAGRPFGRDPTMLWVQQHLIDDGETLGPTLGLFRAAFFSESDHPRHDYAKEYKFKDKLKGKLSKMMEHRSITYAADECIDLPKVVRIVEQVRFPLDTREYYRRMVKQAIAAKGKLKEMKNAFIRMRQISSGFVGMKDDETGEKAEIEFDENPKLELLLDLIDELPLDRKAVVFYEFTYSGRLIMAELKKMNVPAIWLWSGTKDSRAALNHFVDDPECSVAVVNHRVGAYSIDELQAANYMFQYESAVGIIDREQSERRIIRQGQQHKVFIYDLIVQGSVDNKILEFHKEGNDLFKALLRNPNNTLGS